MNDSIVEANVQSLCDGGLLMQVTCAFFYTLLLISWINGFNFMAVLIVELQWLQLDGNSHVIYAEEEAGGTRLQIDGKTCLLQVNTPFLLCILGV